MTDQRRQVPCPALIGIINVRHDHAIFGQDQLGVVVKVELVNSDLEVRSDGSSIYSRMVSKLVL